MGDTVLSLGLHPSAVDSSRYPQITEEMLVARIAAGEVALREAGFDIVTCQVPADPDEAEKKVRECVAERPVQVVMIGAGLRMAEEHTPAVRTGRELAQRARPGNRVLLQHLAGDHH